MVRTSRRRRADEPGGGRENVLVRLDPAPVLVAMRYSGWSVVKVCERLDIERGQWYQWLRAGGFPIHQADRIATTIGRHPTELWGHDFYQPIVTKRSA